MRYLARGSGRVGAEWRSLWEVAKATNTPIFDGPIIDWDINKRALCWWSEFYDKVFDHPERPDRYIIEDNDSLDEWIEQQHKKSEEERKKRGFASKTGRKSAFSHQEVVVFGED